MNQMIIAQLYCFVFLLLLAFGQSTSSKSTNSIFTHYVRIVNHLNNKALTFHCKSANDDLGTTDFYCYFFNKNLHASFDVYVETGSFDANCGGNHCIWTAQEDGFYLYDMIFNQNVKMHDWSK
ncbi:s-protein like protein 1 [Quercus suber]|uniref:S-protein like protein 1 n=1 Tax=Quercus suber TaxID=58331 RepID=A0AAW0JJ51_QUESU